MRPLRALLLVVNISNFTATNPDKTSGKKLMTVIFAYPPGQATLQGNAPYTITALGTAADDFRSLTFH